MQKILVIFLVLIAGNVISENTIIAIVNDIPISLNSIENNFLNTNSNEEKIEILNTQIDIALQLEKVSEFNLKPTIEDVDFVLMDVAKKNNLSIGDLLNLDGIDSIRNEIEEKLSILNLQRFVTKELEKPTKKILDECSTDKLEPDQKQIKIAQIIISEGLTKGIIRIKAIEAFRELAKSQNAKIIITDGKTPLIVGNEPDEKKEEKKKKK